MINDKPSSLSASRSDRRSIRELAGKFAALSASEENRNRIRLWKKHNNLQPVRPMILIFPQGGFRELLPETSLQCENEILRTLEHDMRQKIYKWEHFQSDDVLDPSLSVSKIYHETDWGLKAKWVFSDTPGGARKFDPVILKPSDMKKLRFPEVIYGEELSQRKFIFMQELIGDVIDLKLTGKSRYRFHLMRFYTALRGLEEVMMDMVTEPGWLHDAMAFLEAGHRNLLRQYEDLNLLDLNNDNTNQASGGNGWTDQLPPSDFTSQHVRPKDMWGSSEVQELTLVSPEMHEEFALQYERRLLEPFGLTGYGCCDDLTLKLDYVKTVPNMRRISISPFADVESCAEQLGSNYIFSWKPKPTHLVGEFRPETIRPYIRHTLEICRQYGCVLEMVLKDTHTCENHPERFDLWSRIAREEVDSICG